MTKRKKLSQWVEEHTNNIARIAIIAFFLLLAICAITIEHYELVIGYSEISLWLTTALVSVGPELAGIVIGVTTIDYLNERRQETQLKKQLILQMGSRNNDVTDNAIRTLKAYGFLFDGSLNGIDLWKANLNDTDLWRANLKDADLWKANLVNTRLKEADLENADLREIDLKNANLADANLAGANLGGAKHWSIDQLLLACNLERAIMPDGRLYEEWIQDPTNQQIDEQAIAEVERTIAKNPQSEEE